MEKKIDKKFTWVIKNFSSLQTEKIYSDQFIVGGCKWRLFVYPKGYKVDNSLSLFLEVPDYASLPSGWRRHAKYLLTIANQIPGKPSHTKEIQHWFDEKSINWGWLVMLTLNELHAKDSGYLVKGELKIVVEIDILEIIGKVDVNGFQILPSQVELVSRIFEKYPEIAAEFRPKNPNLRTGCMNLLLGLIDTLRQLPRELPKDDLNEAYVALGYLTDAGFKLDWLKKKFDQASDTKEIEEAGEIRVQEIDKELKDSKQKFSDLEAQLEKEKAEMLASIDKELKDLKQEFSYLEAELGKEKAEVLAAKVPLSFDDVI